MKTIIILAVIGLLCWSLEMKLSTIPNLKEEIGQLEFELAEKEESVNLYKSQAVKLEKRVKELIEIQSQQKEEKAAKATVNPVNAPVVETPVVESKPVDHSRAINELLAQKAANKNALKIKLQEIDGFITKGKLLLKELLAAQQGFDESKIKVSEADAAKQQVAKDERERFLKTEIDKLEAQKISLQREFASVEAQIDMKVIELRNK